MAGKSKEELLEIAVRIIKELESIACGDMDGDRICPFCHALLDYEQHEQHCELNNFLIELGGI